MSLFIAEFLTGITVFSRDCGNSRFQATDAVRGEMDAILFACRVA
jgi:hypothetical protein